jgi:serine protease Do
MQLIVERVSVGKTYPMLIVRDGKEMTINVQVKEMPRDYSIAQDTLVPDKGESAAPKSEDISELGIGVETARPEILKQLGFNENVTGVVINSIKADGPAANAGLREGMVIEKVGSKRITTSAEFKAALQGVTAEKGVLLLVRTPRGSQFLVIHPETK